MCVTTSNDATCSETTTDSGSNPLLANWSNQPFLLPPFQSILPSHFKEAFEHGMEAHLSDLQSIVDNKEDPTFENTIVTYDQAGSALSKVNSVFSNMCSSLNTDGKFPSYMTL